MRVLRRKLRTRIGEHTIERHDLDRIGASGLMLAGNIENDLFHAPDRRMELADDMHHFHYATLLCQRRALSCCDG